MSKIASLAILLIISSIASALSPEEILIIANKSNPASIRVAENYAAKRNVPPKNILILSLDAPLDDSITRSKYNQQIAAPIKAKLTKPDYNGKIKCLLTTYGVPYKVGSRSVMPESEELLVKLTELAEDHEQIIRGSIVQLRRLGFTEYLMQDFVDTAVRDKLIIEAQKQCDAVLARFALMSDADLRDEHAVKFIKLYRLLFGKQALLKNEKIKPYLAAYSDAESKADYFDSVMLLRKATDQKWMPKKRAEEKFYQALRSVYGFCPSLAEIDKDIKIVKGTETSASVDSELSMLMFGDYQLYRYQPNELKQRIFWFDVKTLMVSRLDGPSEKIAIELVDKAIAAERIGLKGSAYFDSGKGGSGGYELYDGYIHDAAALVKNRTDLKVVEETTASLFQPDQCPNTVLYCGWYSLKNYIDAFDFVVGAIGYHIASFEAIDLRDPKTGQWCSSMLRDGITATLGPVAEPYLHTFPRPDEFFSQLLSGKQLVEAYYRTKPYNSWQMMLIGDPLYKPFPKH
jgi:uncharacterized protein (TIGR03790 family)